MSKRILIVEDELPIAELEKDYLELSGFDVEICSNFFLRFIIIFSQISYVFEFHNPILVP